MGGNGCVETSSKQSTVKVAVSIFKGKQRNGTSNIFVVLSGWFGACWLVAASSLSREGKEGGRGWEKRCWKR